MSSHCHPRSGSWHPGCRHETCCRGAPPATKVTGAENCVAPSPGHWSLLHSSCIFGGAWLSPKFNIDSENLYFFKECSPDLSGSMLVGMEWPCFQTHMENLEQFVSSILTTCWLKPPINIHKWCWNPFFVGYHVISSHTWWLNPHTPRFNHVQALQMMLKFPWFMVRFLFFMVESPVSWLPSGNLT